MHEANGPLFSCESVVQPPATKCGGSLLLQTSQKLQTLNGASLARSPERYLNNRAPTRFAARVWGWRHAYADIRSSTGLAPRRGTDCVLCTTRGGCALATLGQVRRRTSKYCCRPLLREADAAVVRRGPAQHLFFDPMQPAGTQLIGDEPLLLPSYS